MQILLNKSNFMQIKRIFDKPRRTSRLCARTKNIENARLNGALACKHIAFAGANTLKRKAFYRAQRASVEMTIKKKLRKS